MFESFTAELAEHGPVWLVTAVLIAAAWIDGRQLRVPNWLTFPMIVSGWVYSGVAFGWEGIGWSLVGTLVGIALLLPAYAIGGMGAGDVKLLGGVGAWGGPTATFYAFCATTVVGGVMAIVMVLLRRGWKKHSKQFWLILNEMMVIRNPDELAAIAADRKSSMMLLPYGIPIALGSIGYFAWTGMLV